MTVRGPLVGTGVRRVEDPRLITGAGQYVEDLRLDETAHAVFLRSYLAHGRIVSLDMERAKRSPGVLTVLTADDFARLGPVPADPIDEQTNVPSRRPLAANRVRHVGEALAMVVADSLPAAVDAVELVSVDIEALPVLTDPDRALDADAPILYDEFGTNRCFEQVTSAGDIDAAFRQAEVVIRQRFVNQRVLPLPLEGRAILASWDGERLTVEMPTQAPHLMRTELAKALGLPGSAVRVIVRDFGGSFGCKGALYGEEIAVAEVARRLGRPVKWIEERGEHCLSTPHGRGQTQYAELAAGRDGTILGLRSQIIADLGAYLAEPTAHVATGTPPVITGCYRVPALTCTVTGVFTNAAPTGPYRGAGRPEAAFQIERLIDLLSQELSRDPADVRRQNFIPPSEFPHVTKGGAVFDSGNYAAALDRCCEIAGYKDLRRWQAKRRTSGGLAGIGLSTFVEMNGGGKPDQCGIRMEADGRMTCYTGSAPHGQGHETAWAQLVADELGLGLEQVQVRFGDTDKPGYTEGTWGSRSAPISGSAAVAAGRRMARTLKRLAADAIEAAPDDIRLINGRVEVAGAPSRGLAFGELAAWARKHGRMAELDLREAFEPPDFVFPFGAHLAAVEIDRETGALLLHTYVAVDDCGVVINPMLVDGQVHGAVAQGIGQALFEGVAYDSDGQLLTANLMTYLLPSAADLPSFHLGRTTTPTPRSLTGAKGVAESGATAAPPAVVNAVMDALAPLGIKHLDMPLTPARVWAAIDQATRRSNRSMMAGA